MIGQTISHLRVIEKLEQCGSRFCRNQGADISLAQSNAGLTLRLNGTVVRNRKVSGGADRL
jgi:hypothetical protein